MRRLYPKISLHHGFSYRLHRSVGGEAGIIADATSIFSGGISNSGTISAGADGIFVENVSTFTGIISNSGTISAQTGIVVSHSGAVSIFDSGTIVGTGGTAVNLSGNAGGNTFTLGPGYSIQGNVVGRGSDIFQRGGSGSGSFNMGLIGTQYTGFTSFNIVSGVWSPTGVFTPSQGWNVSGGTLAGPGGTFNLITVNGGGTLMPGAPNTPGTTMAIGGDVIFNPGSIYAINMSSNAHSQANITGAATINNGTVSLNLQLGFYGSTKIPILTAGGGVTGTFSPAITYNSQKVSLNNAALTYDANDVYLAYTDTPATDTPAAPGMSVTLVLPGNAPGNAQAIVGGINNSIRAGNNVPAGFQNLLNLSGTALNTAVNQLGGQSGSASAQSGFNAGSSFLNMVLNPFVGGRGDGFGAGFGSGSSQTIADNENAPPIMAAPALAYSDDPVAERANKLFSAVMPPSLAVHNPPAPHLTLWGSAYGGVGSITGSAVTGAAATQSQIYDIVAGLDDHIAPDTMIGFALGGGGTSWQLSQGLGSGHAGMAQASVYGSKHFGPAYVSGALAYSWQGVTTDRVVTLAGSDTLSADFGANTVSSRVETGYRLPAHVLPMLPTNIALTPYGAVQAQAMFLPAYSEYASAGSNQFALNYTARDYSTVRTELGSWFDTDLIIAALPFTQSGALKAYGRAAWAHDFNNESAAISFFQQLPGSSFLINAAKPAADSALVTAGLEYKLGDGWSVLTKFDGEYSATTSIFAGTGAIRKVW